MKPQLFRLLTTEEERTFRVDARLNYTPGDPINPLHHPVYNLECATMNLEAYYEHFGVRRNKGGQIVARGLQGGGGD